MQPMAMGLTALHIILASGFSKITDLGELPEAVRTLAGLPDSVSLVRVDPYHFNYHLAEKAASNDMVRGDTAVLHWLVGVIPTVIVDPEYFVPSSKSNHFQVMRRIEPHAKWRAGVYLRLPIKYVPSNESHPAELWLTTAVLQDERHASGDVKRGVSL